MDEHNEIILEQANNDKKNQLKGDSLISYSEGFDYVFVSLNRYERKKNISLAIDALKYLKNSSNSENFRVLLVVAGGYDATVTENREHLLELQTHASSSGLDYTYNAKKYDDITVTGNKDINKSSIFSKDSIKDPRFHVEFRTSISSHERSALLARADALLYTPDREHFGIVPLEAMNAGTPAICVASGGPLETVLHDLTGYLCQQSAEEFGEAMKKFTVGSVTDSERKRLTNAMIEYTKNDEKAKKIDSLDKSLSLSQLMGKIGRAHVQVLIYSSLIDEYCL